MPTTRQRKKSLILEEAEGQLLAIGANRGLGDTFRSDKGLSRSAQPDQPRSEEALGGSRGDVVPRPALDHEPHLGGVEGVQVEQVEEEDGQEGREDDEEGRGCRELQGEFLQVEEEVELAPAVEEEEVEVELVPAVEQAAPCDSEVDLSLQQRLEKLSVKRFL